MVKSPMKSPARVENGRKQAARLQRDALGRFMPAGASPKKRHARAHHHRGSAALSAERRAVAESERRVHGRFAGY